MMPESVRQAQARGLELRVIEILHTVHTMNGFPLKVCGLYKVRGNIIIDKFPSIKSAKTILQAYEIARKEAGIAS